MTAKNRKLCPSCDGSVHIHATKCPYCGSDLAGQAAPFAAHEPPPPQYAPEPTPEAPPPPPYSPYVEEEPVAQIVEVAEEELVAQVVAPSSLIPMLLLIPGAFFLLFGVIMFLFSHDGLLTLSWNAHYWFVYLTIGAPLLYFGWKTLHKEEE